MLELAGIVPADQEERSELGVIPRLDTLELRTVRDLRLDFADGRATSLWIPVVRSGHSLLVGLLEEPSLSRNVVTPPDDEEEKGFPKPEPKESESAVALPGMEGEEETSPEAEVEPKESESAVLLPDEEREEIPPEIEVEPEEIESAIVFPDEEREEIPSEIEVETEEIESAIVLPDEEREEIPSEIEVEPEKIENAADSFGQEAGDEKAEGEESFSPLVRMVRTTPRVTSPAVREAILELCRGYKTPRELSFALNRSENSLRKYYIATMVEEGLLEMEFPEEGRPDQRYKTAERPMEE
jgi:hypothetical protein